MTMVRRRQTGTEVRMNRGEFAIVTVGLKSEIEGTTLSPREKRRVHGQTARKKKRR